MANIYNPGSEIIRSYMEGVRSRQEELAQQQKNVIETERLKQQKEQHEAELKQRQDHFNATHGLAKAMSDLAVIEHKQKIQNSFLETGVAPPDSTVTQQPGETTTPQVPGVIPGSLQPFQAPGTQTLDIPGILHSAGLPNPEQYRTQQANLQRISQQPEIELAGGKAGAEETAKLPGLLQLETTKEAAALKIKQDQFQKDKDLQNLKDIAAGQRATEGHASAERVANIRAYATLHKPVGAKFDEGAAADMVTANEVGSGELSSPNSEPGRFQRSLLLAHGSVPLDKNTIAKLGTLGSIPTFLDTLEKFKNENLPDTSAGIPLSGIKSLIPGTKIKNDLAQIDINAGPVASIFEGLKGRRTMQQMDLAKQAMRSPLTTKAQAQERIEMLRKEAASQISNEVLGNVPEDQKVRILAARPELLKLYPNKIQPNGVHTISLDNGLSWIKVP